MSVFSVKANITAVDKASPVLAKIRKSIKALSASSKKLNGDKVKIGLDGIKQIRAAEAPLARIAKRYSDIMAAANGAAAAIAKVNAALGRQASAPRSQTQAKSPTARTGRYDSFPQNIPRVAAYRAAHEAISAGGRVVGSTGTAISRENRDRYVAKLENLPADIQAAIDKGSRAATENFRTVQQSEINEVTRAAFGNLKSGKAEDAAKLPAVLAQSLTFEKVRTGSSEEAVRSTTRFGKIADFAGKADTPEKLQKTLSLLTSVSIAMGRDLNSDSLLTATRGLKSSLAGLDDSAFIAFVSSVDEVGKRAGNELFQFIDSFSGKRIPEKTMGIQRQQGLRDASGKVLDEQLLNTSPQEWLYKHIIPKMRQQGAKFDNTVEDNAKIASLSKAYELRGTAESFVTREGQKQEERARTISKVKRISEKVTPEEAMAASGSALSLAAESVTVSVGNLADKMTIGLQPAVTGFLDSIARAASNLGKDENLPTTPIGSLAVGGAAVAGAAVVGLASTVIEGFARSGDAQKDHSAAMRLHALALNKGAVESIAGIGKKGGGGALEKLSSGNASKFGPVLSAAGPIGVAAAVALAAYDLIAPTAEEAEAYKESDEAKRYAEVYKPEPSAFQRMVSYFMGPNSGNSNSPGEIARNSAWSSAKTQTNMSEIIGLTPAIGDFTSMVAEMPSKGDEFGARAKEQISSGGLEWGSRAGSAFAASIQGVIGQLQGVTVNVAAQKPAGAEAP